MSEKDRGDIENESDTGEEAISGSESETESDDEEDVDIGLTDNQCRLLYLTSLYTRPAMSEEEKEEWIRKPALMVLIYEGVVAEVLDYDYAPASELVESRRKYFNISQEGKSDVDFLREEELINGLKLSSKQYIPVTCFQVSEKGMEVVKNIPKVHKLPVQELVYAPGTRNLLRVEWDGEEYWLVDEISGFKRASSVTETEEVSYVSSAYVPMCLRHGGRPTLSNAHRAHECGDVDGTSIRDELDEIITLNSVSIIVAEFIPFGANQIVQLNQNLGSTERVQGGFFTAMVDNDAAGTQLNVDPGLTTVNILDYTLTDHINFEADIHFPEPPGVVQVETFGVSINAIGTCFYGMQIEAVMDRIKDNISLDHMARLLVDVHIDSSKIVDSVISSYQRQLLQLVFCNDAPNRDKVNLIVANEITPHLTAEEYMDKGEYENEIKQVLGDTRAAFDISEHDTLIFGAHGLLIAGPNSRHHEPLLCSYLEFISIDIFCRNFFQRLFLVLDDMKTIHKIIEFYEKDPKSVEDIRNRLATVSKEIILMEEILSYLQESLSETHLPPEPPEQAGRSLFERLKISEMKEQLTRRCKDLLKNMAGARHELGVLQQMSDVVSETKMFTIQDSIAVNMRNLCTLQEVNERTASSLEILQVVLAGNLAFSILDRITGDWTVTNTDWMRNFVEPLLHGAPTFWFFCNMVFWACLGTALIKLVRHLGFISRGTITIRMKVQQKVNYDNLMTYVRQKEVEDESHEYDGEVQLAKISWIELDAKAWGGCPPLIALEYDEANHFMLQINITYNRRQANKNLAFNHDELRTRLFQELEAAEIFLDDEAAGAAAGGGAK